MRLRTVNSIILPSAHKVKASARNSVTTVVGGGRERCSGGLLKESPEPPRTFLKFFIGGGGVAVPKGGLPPAGGVPLRGTGSPCRCGKLNGGLAPARHLLSQPRGRGPSQTPKFLSPGPPSPWLPALSPVDKQKPLVVQVPPLAQARGCKGRSPLHENNLNPPLPRRGRGLGG